MSSKYPLLSATKIIGALERKGFVRVSQKGSHVKLKSDGCVVIVPMHAEVARGTLKGILTQAQIELDVFLSFL